VTDLVAHQRARALAKANRARSAQALLKRELRAAADRDAALAMIAALVSDPPPELVHAPLDRLLLACRRVGTERVRTLLRRSTTTASARLGVLTADQRALLLAQLPEPDPEIRRRLDGWMAERAS
jgi:hypothetical protein